MFFFLWMLWTEDFFNTGKVKFTPAESSVKQPEVTQWIFTWPLVHTGWFTLDALVHTGCVTHAMRTTEHCVKNCCFCLCLYMRCEHRNWQQWFLFALRCRCERDITFCATSSVWTRGPVFQALFTLALVCTTWYKTFGFFLFNGPGSRRDPGSWFRGGHGSRVGVGFGGCCPESWGLIQGMEWSTYTTVRTTTTTMTRALRSHRLLPRGLKFEYLCCSKNCQKLNSRQKDPGGADAPVWKGSGPRAMAAEVVPVVFPRGSTHACASEFVFWCVFLLSVFLRVAPVKLCNNHKQLLRCQKKKARSSIGADHGSGLMRPLVHPPPNGCHCRVLKGAGSQSPCTM